MEREVFKSFAIIICAFLAVASQSGMAAGQEQTGAADDKYMRLEVCLTCHETQYDAIRSTAHWASGDARAPASVHQCSSCHGNLAQHVESEGALNTGGMQAYGKASMMTPPEQNAVCMGCHKEASLLHWEGSGHAADDVGCVGCHRVHQEDKVRSRQTEAQVCFTCHMDIRAETNKPFGHPLREQKMSCSDCHNPHGGQGDADLKTFTINEACYGCHAEKRGPFLWEHPPASENCLLCHSAHGSIHKDMLERREPHLCQSCHEPTGAAGEGPPHAQHSRLALSFRAPGEPDQGPNLPPPPVKGISRFVMGEACSNCHNKVHGTNHPAGAGLTR